MRLLKNCVIALFRSFKIKTSGDRTLQCIYHRQPNQFLYNLLNSTGDYCECLSFRDQIERGKKLSASHEPAETGHLYLMIATSDLFRFVND